MAMSGSAFRLQYPQISIDSGSVGQIGHAAFGRKLFKPGGVGFVAMLGVNERVHGALKVLMSCISSQTLRMWFAMIAQSAAMAVPSGYMLLIHPVRNISSQLRAYMHPNGASNQEIVLE
jgi:hypothetical protein